MTRVGRRAVGVGVWMVLALGAATLPWLNPDPFLLGQSTQLLIDIIAALGLAIAVGYVGLLNLGAGALMGVGAYLSAVLTATWGWPLLLAVAAATIVGAIIGALVLSAALRLGQMAFALVSLYLAATFSDLVVLPALRPLTTTTAAGISGIPPLISLPFGPGSDVSQASDTFWLVLAIATAAVALVALLISSPLGRAMRSVRDDDLIAASSGINPLRVRLLAVAASSLLCALSGALMAHANTSCLTSCSLSAQLFPVTLSALLFSAVIIGGRTTVAGPILGVVLVGLPSLIVFGSNSSQNTLATLIADGLLYGLVLLLAAWFPQGIWGWLRSLVPLRRPRPLHQATESAPPVSDPGPLGLRGITVRFGPVTAVDGVWMECDPGTIHALVGANGSGKTTLLNAVTGLVPHAGVVEMDALPLGGAAHERARRGIGRTFQTPRLVLELPLAENVAIGSDRFRRRNNLSRAQAELEALGLGPIGHLPGWRATHGQRRLTELARALRGEPRVLLLDEPTSGLDPDAVAALEEALRRERSRGCAVLLVEHNLDFVRAVADTVTVLDKGRVLAQGTPDSVLQRPEVVHAFIGTAA